MEKKIKDMKKANIALYTVWAGDTFDEADVVLDDWLKGQSTHFVIDDEIGVAIRSDFRKVMLDLETMKVISADPSSGKLKSIDSMIDKCKELKPPRWTK